MELGVGAQLVGGTRLRDRRAVANAGERVGDQRIVAGRIDDRIGCRVRQTTAPGDPHELQVAARLFRDEVLLELEIKPIAKN